MGFFVLLGITFGRFLNGFVTDKLGNRNMIRIGLGIITIGLAAVILPVQIELVTLAGLVLIGIGCAPIYPCIIHETPKNFGAENSQAIIGIQMASAYTGSTFMRLYLVCWQNLQRFFISGLFDILPDFDDSNDGKA